MSLLNIDSIDKRFKWALLIGSVLTLLFLTAAALKENIFPQWRMIRLRYALLLKEQAVDERSQAIADNFEVRLIQNVLPELDTIDRCITCHPGIDDPRMADQAQPFRTHPGDYLKHHPPETFGCTICHRGQGRAVVFKEAKAVGYHWDYPLLPLEYTQASCGICHGAGEVAAIGGETYAEGRRLYVEKGCASCHKLDGRGGNLGPALDGEGLKVRGQLPMAHIEGPHTLPQWLMEHFEDPQSVVAGSQMPPPRLSRDESRALTVYMLSLQNRDLPRTYLSPEKHLELYKLAHPDPQSGEQLFSRYCSRCHDTGTYGRYDPFFNKFLPAVRGASLIATASRDYLVKNIRNGRPGTLMPAWGRDSGGLSEDEIGRLVDYLLIDAPPAGDSLARTWDGSFVVQGNPLRGTTIFAKHCSGCHGPGGQGDLAPTLANPVFQQAASDGFLYVTIAMGRKNTAMPGFLGMKTAGFASSDIEDLVAYLRSLDSAPTLASKKGIHR
jgi:mono/diheme cytochrome c family protein